MKAITPLFNRYRLHPASLKHQGNKPHKTSLACGLSTYMPSHCRNHHNTSTNANLKNNTNRRAVHNKLNVAMACIDTRLNAIIMEMNTHTSYQVYQAIHTINSHTDIVHQ